MKKIYNVLVLAIAAGQLAACQTTGTNPSDQSKPATDKKERIESAKAKAGMLGKHTAGSGKLLTLEKQYKRDSNNPQTALAYANALRKANYLNRAETILSPFAATQNAPTGINAEMSAISLGLENYDNAEKYAQASIRQDPEDYNAYQNLGIALDAKEMHPEAERAFRKGLEHWQGDPTSIMNNLALNLATQGFIDEAIEMLERAKKLSPNRIELERNLRIIRTLNER